MAGDADVHTSTSGQTDGDRYGHYVLRPPRYQVLNGAAKIRLAGTRRRVAPGRTERMHAIFAETIARAERNQRRARLRRTAAWALGIGAGILWLRLTWQLWIYIVVLAVRAATEQGLLP